MPFRNSYSSSLLLNFITLFLPFPLLIFNIQHTRAADRNSGPLGSYNYGPLATLPKISDDIFFSFSPFYLAEVTNFFYLVFCDGWGGGRKCLSIFSPGPYIFVPDPKHRRAPGHLPPSRRPWSRSR